METIAKIRRLYHVERLGFKTIAKALNISKNTIKSIIRRQQVSPNVIRRSSHHPVLEPYIQMTEDEQAPKKYRRIAKKLFLELQQGGASFYFKA